MQSVSVSILYCIVGNMALGVPVDVSYFQLVIEWRWKRDEMG